MKLETLSIHAGRTPDPGTGAVMAPIHLSTTFVRNTDGTYPHGYVYTRTENPNRTMVEERLCQLEGGVAAAAFSSGQAATMALLQTLRSGDHIVIPNDVYFGTGSLAKSVFGPWGLAVSTVDMTDPTQVERAIQPNTRLVWIETPSNPLLKITDIRAVADLAHRHDALCIVDNTWPSPILQQPLSLGADVAMHATTKYLGGHSDLLGGALVVREEGELLERIRLVQTTGGSVPSPFDCWLLARSICTLPYRMRAHCENAMRVAEYLVAQPKLAAVHYPGLASHPGHSVARQQMSGFGGMISIQVEGGASAAMALAGRLQLFAQATSLGGVESLVEHRASVEGPQSQTPQNLLRLSIGLEHPEDLIADLAQALA